MPNETPQDLAELLDDGRSGPILCHTDLFGAASQVKAGYKRQEILHAHLNHLLRAASGRPIWVPTFNYDFPKSKLFDCRYSRSQVGPFTEFFRLEAAEWRAPVPMFSFAGTGPFCGYLTEEVDAFGHKSIFAEIVQRDSTVLFYGAEVISATILHHAECFGQGPLYRYSKNFRGAVVALRGERIITTLRSHVRPLGRGLTYDGLKMTTDLRSEGVLRALPETQGRVSALSARELVEFWRRKIENDPFYLLDPPSRRWVEPAITKLGRRFRASDFGDVDEC